MGLQGTKSCYHPSEHISYLVSAVSPHDSGTPIAPATDLSIQSATSRPQCTRNLEVLWFSCPSITPWSRLQHHCAGDSYVPSASQPRQADTQKDVRMNSLTLRVELTVAKSNSLKNGTWDSKVPGHELLHVRVGLGGRAVQVPIKPCNFEGNRFYNGRI